MILKSFRASFSASRLAVPLSFASVVGAVTGLAVVAFIWLFDRTETFFLGTVRGSLSAFGGYALMGIPVLGGLLIGLISMVTRISTREQGVPEVLKSLALKGGRMSPVKVLTRTGTAILALGSGFSTGREGPAVYLGAGIGSNIARLFHMSESRMKNLAACGAAAGISAVFNAPITGVMFALEVILKDFGARALSTVVVASVSASIISRIFLGASPAFKVPFYVLRSPWEIFIYMGLGILSAFVAFLFILTMEKSDALFENIRLPDWLKPTLGGLCVGIIALRFPQVMGMGFHAIEATLHGEIAAQILFALIFLKILATSLSLGSGCSGGTFAPTLFVGGALGGTIGHLVQSRMPFPVSSPGAYALVGMASVFAGSFHSPVTAILLVFEMTGDYQIILPLMAAAVISASLAQLIRRESIDTVKFKKQGIDMEHMAGGSFLAAIQVRDAMSRDFVTVPCKMGGKELVERMSKDKDKVFFAVNSRDEVVGVISRSAVQEVLLDENLQAVIADDMMTPLREFCHTDEPLAEAAHWMKLHRMDYLPVMSPEQPGKISGILRSDDVFRAYTDLAVRRDELVSRMEQEGSVAEGTINIRFHITGNSPVSGKLIRELQIPDGVVLTSLQRKHVVVIPEGHTQLKPKDKVWAVVLSKREADFRAWLKEQKLR